MFAFDQDFPKADPAPRGCGDREPGGIYAECGLSSKGRPLEEFLIDPPLPIPPGLDLVNKPQTWQRLLPSGEPALDGEGLPIFDLLIWVGQEHYPYVPDYLEEVIRFGVSRRLNPNLDLSLLSKSSRMILAHSQVINTAWKEQRPPESCKKEIPGHDIGITMSYNEAVNAMDESERDMIAGPHLQDINNGMESHLPLVQPNSPQAGPCLFKLWDLIPREAAQTVIDAVDVETGNQGFGTAALPLCLREIGSTIYQYRPTGESADGLLPGIFAVLPITGIALIRFQDGSVNEQAKEKIQAGRETHGSHAIPVYETDR
jgi:hypothetical protein